MPRVVAHLLGASGARGLHMESYDPRPLVMHVTTSGRSRCNCQLSARALEWPEQLTKRSGKMTGVKGGPDNS